MPANWFYIRSFKIRHSAAEVKEPEFRVQAVEKANRRMGLPVNALKKTGGRENGDDQAFPPVFRWGKHAIDMMTSWETTKAESQKKAASVKP